MFTFVGSHLCLYASLCVHACACEACRRMSADICFCVCNLCVSMHICVFVCVCMNAQAQICLVKVIFFPSSYRFFFLTSRLSVPTVIRMCFEFTGVHLCMNSCYSCQQLHYRRRCNVPEQDSVGGGAAGW